MAARPDSELGRVEIRAAIDADIQPVNQFTV